MTINNNYDKYNPAKIYGNWVLGDTTKYQKKYEFEIGKGAHATWNNEADAFKHTFMQAQLSLMFGEFLAEQLGNKHERDGNNKMGQSQGEENMDLWNNHQGREIAKEIIREYGALQYPFSQKTKDIIAQKVMEKMQNGELITKPDDNRKYEDLLKGQATGYAIQVEPFTREQIGAMSGDEFLQNEKAIREQWGKIGIPSEQDLPKESKKSASKSNGSSKDSRSADGKWVTINGNHVLIKD